MRLILLNDIEPCMVIWVSKFKQSSVCLHLINNKRAEPLLVEEFPQLHSLSGTLGSVALSQIRTPSIITLKSNRSSVAISQALYTTQLEPMTCNSARDGNGSRRKQKHNTSTELP